MRLARDEQQIVESSEVRPGLVLDLSEQGDIVGLDFEHAAKHFDLKALFVGSERLSVIF
ncbi:MAG: DUF2283 domain-containing protein [Candidatus Eremiobacteraeota bacterium]|nr:DUF2283 domain-containing protein [Candidatus Eremiobacteraeota bacterium]